MVVVVVGNKVVVVSGMVVEVRSVLGVAPVEVSSPPDPHPPASMRTTRAATRSVVVDIIRGR
jgi:hypothetical protein